MNKKILIVAVSIVLLFVIGVFCLRKQEEVISSDEVSEKVINFIANTYMMDREELTLVDMEQESGVYRITLGLYGELADVFATLDGEIFFFEGFELKEVAPHEKVVGGFIKTEDESCLEDGKPIVYFFGSESCPYCAWELPVITEAMEQFEEELVFKAREDLEENADIFFRYSDGSVPLVVMGCNYFRIGAGGYEGDEEKEFNVLTTIACKLTGGEPGDVCEPFIEEINEL